jgi:transmembrane sensor
MDARYRSYSSTQLAGEDSFVRWVRHGEQSREWQTWVDQQPEVHRKVDEARKIVLTLSSSSTADLSATEKAELWNRIHSKIEKEPVKNKSGRVMVLWKWGLAAAAALTLVVWINHLTSNEKVFAQTGEQKEINLPEGSAVILNAGSAITYKSATFEKDRILQLDGEAFFKVKSGSTFSVKTSKGTVTVVGTSFNVYSRGDRFEVNCYTGKVKVQASSKNEQLITAGQRTLLTENGLAAIPFSPTEETPGWTSGKFSFDDQPLTEVIGELERQYDVNVTMAPGLETERYTGFFESGNLDEALELITWPLHLTATKKGKTITISR